MPSSSSSTSSASSSCSSRIHKKPRSITVPAPNHRSLFATQLTSDSWVDDQDHLANLRDILADDDTNPDGPLEFMTQNIPNVPLPVQQYVANIFDIRNEVELMKRIFLSLIGCETEIFHFILKPKCLEFYSEHEKLRSLVDKKFFIQNPKDITPRLECLKQEVIARFHAFQNVDNNTCPQPKH